MTGEFISYQPDMSQVHERYCEKCQDTTLWMPLIQDFGDGEGNTTPLPTIWSCFTDLEQAMKEALERFKKSS